MDNIVDHQTITSAAITSYISFSVIFFVVCLFNDWSAVEYMVMFLVFTFIIQFAMNMWASSKLCPTTDKESTNIATPFGYTFVPWLLIMVCISLLLYIMPGWVRVFSNTIGLAVVRSVYAEIFEYRNPDTPATEGNAAPANAAPANAAPVNAAPENAGGINKELLLEIYRDPSKLINEIEYLSDFEEWYNDIYIKRLSGLPFFDNDYFKHDPNLFEGTGEDKKPKKDHHVYQLYKCVATKEKIGYFIWLFLSGAIFTLTSLSQMYEAQC